MTTATRPARDTEPTHASLSCYKHHHCRRPECVQRYRDWQKNRYRRRGYGTWQPFVDAEPVRQHLLHLRDAGISYATAAREAGLYPATVSAILYDIAGRPRKKKLRPETAAKLLAVKPRLDLMPDRRPIDATGTRRRIHALVTIGWPMTRLGEHIGIHPTQPRWLTVRPTVQARSARAVAAAYDRLWNTDPTHYGVSPGSALKARRMAARHGWAPPAAWDDEAIDDPTATPAAITGLRAHELAAVLAEEIQHLASFGISVHEIARRVGRSESYVRDQIGGHRGPGWRNAQRAAEQDSEAAA